MNRWTTGFLGAVLEAWTELRIHRTRVLLSLIGVAVAVTAITTVVALGQLAEQAQTEQMERGSGRPAMLGVYAYATGSVPLKPAISDKAFQDAVDRYSVEYTSRNTYLNTRVQFSDGAMDVSGQVADVDYGTMHRVKLLQGSWFTAADENRLAPAIIVNEFWWKKLGSPDLGTHPTAQLLGASPTTAVIVGVTPSPEWDTQPSFIMLYSAYTRITPEVTQEQAPPSYEMWVPIAMAEDLTAAVKRDITGALGKDASVDVSRQDYLAYVTDDPLLTLKLMVAGGALLVLLLGALGLVNISLVTVRQRIREIGIRRSFGATAGRVFFAVMMESIVATFVAGVVGVVAAILLVQSPLVQNVIGQGIVDLPPFPAQAALLGILASVVVGALAGLLPALVAVRVKVIDAIRY